MFESASSHQFCRSRGGLRGVRSRSGVGPGGAEEEGENGGAMQLLARVARPHLLGIKITLHVQTSAGRAPPRHLSHYRCGWGWQGHLPELLHRYCLLSQPDSSVTSLRRSPGLNSMTSCSSCRPQLGCHPALNDTSLQACINYN